MHSLCIFVAAVTLVVVSCEDPKDHKLICLGTEMIMSDKMKATRETCWNKINPGKTIEEVKKSGTGFNPCLPICDFKELGLMTSDNKFDKTQIKSFAAFFNFPQEAVDPVVAKWTTCIDDKGSNLDIKEGNCQNADPVVKCFFDSIHEVCKKTA